jgi:hypothetical protein
MHTQKSNSTIRFAENPPIAHLEVNFSAGKAREGKLLKTFHRELGFNGFFSG